MFYPLPPAAPSIPTPQATAQYNALRPPQAPLPASLRFGDAKAPISANPFVWVLNGIKSLYDCFSKTKVGQWVNRLLSKINQFLKAKPKENPKPAPPAPTPSPAPASTPEEPKPAVEAANAAPSPAADSSPAIAAPPPPEAPSPPPLPPVAAAPEIPQPPATEPVASKPPFVPYSERSLEALQKRQAKFQKLHSRLSLEQAELEKDLEHLENMRAKQQTQLENALLPGASKLKSSIPDIRKRISILNAQIETLTQDLKALPTRQDFIQQRMLELQDWIQFRQELQVVE